MQGPAQTLWLIADKIITLRGVATGELPLIAALIPPLHRLAAPTRQAPGRAPVKQSSANRG